MDGWIELPSEQIAAWNQKLFQTDASVYQYPYWNESHRRPYFTPRYLVYGSIDRPAAYVCIFTVGIPGAFIGLVEHGPVTLVADSTTRMSAICALVRWAKRHGYMFLRFTDSDRESIESIASIVPAKRFEAFPLRAGFTDDLIVEQLDEDNEMLASFNVTARQNINKARRLGYAVEVTDSPERLTEIWPLLEARAMEKGFQPVPLRTGVSLVRSGREHKWARLYAAHRNGELVQAILVIRDRTTAYYSAGGINLRALQGRSSYSPSCLLHWVAMRDFYRLGVKYYSLGLGTWIGNPSIQFKLKFRPVERAHSAPAVVVTNPLVFQAWSTVGQPALSTLWPRIRPMVRRLLVKSQPN